LKDSKVVLDNEAEISRLSFSRKNTLNKGIHVVILVHGYNGSSWDLHALRVALRNVNRNILTYSSCINSSALATGSSLLLQGKKLAEEIHEYIKKRELEHIMTRLSFVSFSIGGLIARVALGHLKTYQPCFHAFVSLNTPHLGYSTELKNFSAIGAGIWALQKIQRSKALLELRHADGDENNKPTLEVLNEGNFAKNIGTFKYAVFLGTEGDVIAPINGSALLKDELISDSKLDRMRESLLRTLLTHNVQVYHIHAVFPEVKASGFESALDTVIVRQNHLLVIKSEHFTRLFSGSFRTLWDE